MDKTSLQEIEHIPKEETGALINTMTILLEIAVFEKGTVIDAQMLPDENREVFNGMVTMALPRQPRDFVRGVMLTIEKVLVGIFCSQASVQHPAPRNDM